MMIKGIPLLGKHVGGNALLSWLVSGYSTQSTSKVMIPVGSCSDALIFY